MKNMNDMRYTSWNAQKMSNPNHRWLSTMGNAFHRKGAMSKANGSAGNDPR